MLIEQEIRRESSLSRDVLAEVGEMALVEHGTALDEVLVESIADLGVEGFDERIVHTLIRGFRRFEQRPLESIRLESVVDRLDVLITRITHSWTLWSLSHIPCEE